MGNILSVILAKEPDMTKKEKKLSEYIKYNYQDVVNLSVHELAKKSGVSAATIVRFCKRLKVDGFSDFKLHLSVIAAQPINMDDYAEIHPGEDITTIKTKMKARFKTAIDATSSSLDNNVIQKAVDLLFAAPRIEVFGLGSSKLVANDIYQKMLRIGKAINATTDFHMAASELVNLPKNSVFIIVSNSGKTTEDIDLLKLANTRNIKTLSLTANSKSQVADLSDVVLKTQSVGEPEIRSGATTSLISQLFVVDNLLFNYISQHPAEILDRLKLSSEAIRKYKR